MMKVAWNSIYAHPLPDNHRFPMEKYKLLPQQLIHEGTLQKDDFFSPRKLTEQEVLSIHSKSYWVRLAALDLSRQEERRSGFPLSEELVRRELTINGGTVQAAHYALDHGIAMNIAGGTHHAYADHAEGFCLLNDIAVAARYLIDKGLSNQILVIDLDVHQGNGTANIFQSESAVFTFSMHGEKNYPMHKEKSNLDIPLKDGTKDREYINLVKNEIPKIINKVKPDFIFFQSGVDVLESDKLGRLSLTIEGCRWRDEIVFENCSKFEIPIVAVMGGGYSEDINTIIEAHANTFRIASQILT